MDEPLKFVTTGDGSKTLWNAAVGEHYHSRHGALQESIHVFLNSGLRYFLAGAEARNASILEVGFGTGLNFLLTANYCTGKPINLDYVGIEANPLSETMISETGYNQYVSPETWQAFLECYPSALQNPADLNGYCRLQIANTQLLSFNTAQKFDVIYFDAFAAIHQPEMWDEAAIGHTISYLKPGGVFVTYAITGNLKRMLKGLGLKVEKAPGAPGKREMLRATLPI